MRAKGWRLRRRLVEGLERFEWGVFGITLTVDGALYDSPYDAWQDVRHRRLLPRLVMKLSNRGHLASRAYFWVIEFQSVTKQPHWHLLVDAKRIPFGEIVELWSANRPASAPKLAERVTAENYKNLDRPALGSVRFSRKAMKASTAANYASKYLIKPPEDGYPDWVLDHEGRVPRYGTSRGFFSKDAPEDGGPAPATTTPTPSKPSGFAAVHGPDCFCAVCRGEVVDSRVKRRSLKTVRDRLEACGGRSMLIHATATEQSDGTMRFTDRSFGRMIDVPFKVLENHLASEANNKGQIVRDIGYDPDVHQLESTYRRDQDGEEGEGW